MLSDAIANITQYNVIRSMEQPRKKEKPPCPTFMCYLNGTSIGLLVSHLVFLHPLTQFPHHKQDQGHPSVTHYALKVFIHVHMIDRHLITGPANYSALSTILFPLYRK